VLSAHPPATPSGIRIIEATTPRDRDRFITFARQIYRGNPNWPEPLVLERRAVLNPRSNPFFEHAEMALFLAVDAAGDVHGRIAAIVNQNHILTHNEQVGFFGFFECEDDPAIARALVDAAAAYLRARGMVIMRGPENPSVNDDIGLLIDGFDVPPSIMMPYNPPYYAGLLEACGCVPKMKLLAWYGDVRGEDTTPEVKAGIARIERGVALVRKRYGFTVRPATRRNFDADVEKIHYAYSEAWKENWGAVAMTDREFKALAGALKYLADLDLCLIAEVGGEVAGFSLALPDYNQALFGLNGRLLPFGWAKLLWNRRKIRDVRILTMGVVKKFRGMGIDTVFYHETIKAGLAKGYHGVEASWILETNAAMNLILEKTGAKVTKRYQIYDLPL
jgi:hypothetical protein